jgi:hypothetical protein
MEVDEYICYIAIYQNIPDPAALLTNPCNNTATNATLLGAAMADNFAIKIVNVLLSAGVSYTVVVSGDSRG